MCFYYSSRSYVLETRSRKKRPGKGRYVRQRVGGRIISRHIEYGNEPFDLTVPSPQLITLPPPRPPGGNQIEISKETLLVEAGNQQDDTKTAEDKKEEGKKKGKKSANEGEKSAEEGKGKDNNKKDETSHDTESKKDKNKPESPSETSNKDVKKAETSSNRASSSGQSSNGEKEDPKANEEKNQTNKDEAENKTNEWEHTVSQTLAQEEEQNKPDNQSGKRKKGKNKNKQNQGSAQQDSSSATVTTEWRKDGGNNDKPEASDNRSKQNETEKKKDKKKKVEWSNEAEWGNESSNKENDSGNQTQDQKDNAESSWASWYAAGTSSNDGAAANKPDEKEENPWGNLWSASQQEEDKSSQDGVNVSIQDSEGDIDNDWPSIGYDSQGLETNEQVSGEDEWWFSTDNDEWNTASADTDNEWHEDALEYYRSDNMDSDFISWLEV